MNISGMNHFTVLSSDLEKSKTFYIRILGLKEGFRPAFSFPGAWLYAGNQAILHIMTGKPMPTNAAGVIDHMAFSARDLKAVKARLDERGLKYDLRRQAESGTWQLFTFDPNGARVELDFDPSESV